LEDRLITWPIQGGILTRRSGGSLELTLTDNLLTARVHGYHPRLPALLYRLIQLPLHHWITRQSLRRLIKTLNE
jgi:hypothetical protein